MKINKLLFFLLAVFSLNSCVEYVDNGTKPDGPEKPEEQKFTAKHNNAEEAKYVGDDFEFAAMLNNLDVTSTTIFKVNGTQIKGNVYTPHKTGSHSVVATMDNFTANFKFTVLEKDDEPEPTGNRIEYGGKSYPFTSNSLTQWAVYVDQTSGVPVKFEEKGALYTAWQMANVEFDSTGEEIINSFITTVLVPRDTDEEALLPYEPLSGIIHVSGRIVINKKVIFDTNSVVYTFSSSGNTEPTGGSGTMGTANYSGVVNGKNSGETASVFWEGAYRFATIKYTPPAPKTNQQYKTKHITPELLKQLKNYRIVK